jgi:hypothetical protein
MDDKNFPELAVPREVAAVRRCTVNHLANERSRGRGPVYVRIGRRVFYPARELRAYIAERTVDPSGKAPHGNLPPAA